MSKNTAIPLPKVCGKTIDFEYFPTSMQAFIFKNWDIVPKERIALCLETSVKNIEKQAEKMGLEKQDDVSVWLSRGYISIIKQNWFLLDYDQLLTLLGWDEQRLAIVLKEEDFLDIKLGSEKPVCPKIVYRELSAEEEAETEKIRNLMKENFSVEVTEAKKPFDFFGDCEDFFSAKNYEPDEDSVVIDDSWSICNYTENTAVEAMADRFSDFADKKMGVSLSRNSGADKEISLLFFNEEKEEEYHEIDVKKDKIVIVASDSAGILRALVYIEDIFKKNGKAVLKAKRYKRHARFKTRFIYSFCGLYNDALDADSTVYCPDELLRSYSLTGVNGIWIQAVLYRLCDFEFEPKLSSGWKKRLENLKKFAERAADYGIKIYLYINEPRAVSEEAFERFPNIKGNVLNGYACLCTSTNEVRKYLRKAVETVCKAVPQIGGFFTITMSENLTNCYSKQTEMTCPRCGKREKYEVIAEINSLIAESAHKINPKIRIFAWNWSWRLNNFMSSEEVNKCVSLTDKSVIFMANRETGIETNVANVKGHVEDYTVSVCGLSPQSCEMWDYAVKCGYETCAKLQINNSWECSTVPYLPVYGLIEENIRALREKGIEHLMLSWTLGGYPSPNIKFISHMFFEDEDNDTEEADIYRILYGEYADKVHKASDMFSEAFKEFPFDLEVLYNGPQNGGVSNIMFLNPTGKSSTMTCFAMDDLYHWRSVYQEDVFENQFKILSEKWMESLKVLDEVLNCEVKNMAEAAYIQFRSSYNQIRFVRARNRYIKNKEIAPKNIMTEAVEEEKKLAVKLYLLMLKHPSIGFEAANHYYFTAGMLKEKVLNCDFILRKLME